jgi:thiamine biosynthesis protein ThiI
MGVEIVKNSRIIGGSKVGKTSSPLRVNLLSDDESNRKTIMTETRQKEKVVCLVSGGIDSPVACALVAREFEVLPLHFCLYPYTCEETFLTAMKILGDLKRKIAFEKVIVYPWSRILRTILSNREHKGYTCLACRKSMFRVAEIVCEREGASGIVTGESIGQKASQTLPNLTATSQGVRFPILRPLLGFDKLEIERLSKELGIWHEVHTGCCYATPRYPKTRANPNVLNELLDKIHIGKLISKEFKNVLEVRTFEEDFGAYLETLV